MTVLDIKTVLKSNNNDYIIKKHNGLYLIKYNKSSLNETNIQTLGLFRSVITDGENILSFAPPKSINYNTFNVDNHFADSQISEFIDGTMINVFYNGEWELATRSNIGANCRFNLNSKKTFREMFFEACVPEGTQPIEFLNKLNKEYSYSFVLQHPENRIVHKIDFPQLYLTNIYKCSNNTVEELDFLYDFTAISKEKFYISDHIKYPRNIKEIFPNMTEWTYINLLCSGQQTDFNLQGFVIYNENNERTKIRNIDYEIVKRLRGNSPKLQFQFLELYKKNKLKEYLNYFPENSNVFMQYQNEFYKWTETFYNLYIDCFIEKKKQLKNCQYEFKPLLYELQKHYFEELRPNNKKVNFTFMKEYVKTIPTKRLMFSINYKYKVSQNNDLTNQG